MIVWMAYGINRTVSGVERYIIDMSWAVGNGPLGGFGRPLILVDEDASWPEHLHPTAEVAYVPRARCALLATPKLLRQLLASNNVTGLYSFAAALPKCRVKTFATIHDFAPFHVASRMEPRARASWGAAIATNLIRADQLVFTNPSIIPRVAQVARKSIAYLPKPVLPHLTDGTVFDPVSVPFILFVGSARPHKRLDVIVQAANRMKSGGVVVGIGSGTNKFVANNYIGLGTCSDELVAAAYEECKAIVLISAYEGLGLPVRDAVSRGKPAIVSEEVARRQWPEYLGHLQPIADLSPLALAKIFDRYASSSPNHPRVCVELGVAPWARYPPR